MRKAIVSIALAALTAALLVTLYVYGGDDNDPGTEARPWRTIGKAATTLVAGGTAKGPWKS